MNYKFKPQDKVQIISFIGLPFMGEIFSRYTSDSENHASEPHNRYVVIEYEEHGNRIKNVHDLYEKELENIDESKR